MALFFSQYLTDINIYFGFVIPYLNFFSYLRRLKPKHETLNYAESKTDNTHIQR